MYEYQNSIHYIQLKDSQIFLQTQEKSWSLKIYRVLLIYNQRKRYSHHKILNYILTVCSEGCFLITCQNFLMSSYLQEHGSSVNTRSSLIPFKAFPFHDIRCRDTRLNTKFNYTNTEINPTIVLQKSSNMNCKARTCRILNLNRQATDETQYWCNHTVSLKHIPEGESNILDSEDIIGPCSQPYQSQQPAGANQSFPAPETNIWPRPASQHLPLPDED